MAGVGPTTGMVRGWSTDRPTKTEAELAVDKAGKTLMGWRWKVELEGSTVTTSSSASSKLICQKARIGHDRRPMSDQGFQIAWEPSSTRSYFEPTGVPSFPLLLLLLLSRFSRVRLCATP